MIRLASLVVLVMLGGTAAAQPGMAQPVTAPVAPAVPYFPYRQSITVEAELGVGFVHLGLPPTNGDDDDDDGTDTTSRAGLAAAVGVGDWLSPRLALTGRMFVQQLRFEGGDGGLQVQAFIGPALQYWVTPQVWVGGGIGYSTVRYLGGDCNGDCNGNGLGFDVRLGYTLADTAHSFDVSVELTPAFYSDAGTTITVTGFAVMAGYQFL